MKRCSCCGHKLPKSYFWKNKHSKDGLQSYCKECQTLMTSKAYKADVVRQSLQNMVAVYHKSQEDYVLKGIKINILNYVKKPEKRFNIQNLNNGEFYSTNDKESFFLRLEKILQRGAA